MNNHSQSVAVMATRSFNDASRRQTQVNVSDQDTFTQPKAFSRKLMIETFIISCALTFGPFLFL